MKSNWIKHVVPILAFTAGIIISSIGGIMTLSSALELSFFKQDRYSYISEEECKFQKEVELPVQEIEKCMEERREQETERFKEDKKRDIVDGISFLVVGGILLLSFRKRALG